MVDDLLASLPHAIQRFVAAINAADTDAFVATFAEDGFVDDWGRRLSGADGVRSWAQTDAIGANARIRILTAVVSGGVVTTTFSWSSNVFNGESTGVFELAGDRIASFMIPPNH